MKANMELLKNTSLAWGFVRSLNYTAQSALLPIIDKLTGPTTDRTLKDFGEHLKITFPKARALYEKDAQNISEGLYPVSVFIGENPIKHYARIPGLLKDLLRANGQRREKEAHIFAKEEESFLNEAPDYYRRNFHFQDGGYLSENSARLYDHQVEILFAGTAQAMRRQTIPVLKAHFNNPSGKGLRFLEIASGTGSLTRALALAFPEAQIVCLDPSPHYLKYAKNRLKNFKRLSFIQGYGENLDFKDETFDAVISCYLFHELPAKIREEVVKEKHRVLKNQGLAVFADSIQTGDDTDLQWALDKFPVDFHEPFYKNYVEHPIEDLFTKIFGAVHSRDIHFLTKVVSAAKMETDRL